MKRIKAMRTTPNILLNSEWDAVQDERFENANNLEFFIIDCECNCSTMWKLEYSQGDHENREHSKLDLPCPRCSVELSVGASHNKYIAPSVRILETWDNSTEDIAITGLVDQEKAKQEARKELLNDKDFRSSLTFNLKFTCKDNLSRNSQTFMTATEISRHELMHMSQSELLWHRQYITERIANQIFQALLEKTIPQETKQK